MEVYEGKMTEVNERLGLDYMIGEVEEVGWDAALGPDEWDAGASDVDHDRVRDVKEAHDEGGAERREYQSGGDLFFS